MIEHEYVSIRLANYHITAYGVRRSTDKSFVRRPEAVQLKKTWI
jgi:hypothetical protein